MNIENIGTDKYDGKLYTVYSNASSASLEHWSTNFPTLSPHQSELNDAENAKITLNCTTSQYVYRPRKKIDITSSKEKQKIIDRYQSLIQKYPKLMWDFYYQYYPKYAPSKKEREAIIDIQCKADATIISDYESNIEQDVEKFETQILELRDDNPGYVVSPTVDMGIQTIGLFGKKLQKLIDHGFNRFNIVYRSIYDQQVNWIELSKKISGIDIWCNVVGIPQRYISRTNPISIASIVYLYGVHTASLGYPNIRTDKTKPKPKTKILNFNSQTHTFEETTEITNVQSRAYSINSQISQLELSIPHIVNQTYYSKFIKSKSNLHSILQSIT